MEINLDSPERFNEIRSKILRKRSLRALYSEFYREYRNCIAHCPPTGIALELGSGAGFAKEFVPDLVTSDVVPYPEIDAVIDGTNMPYADNSLRALFLFNVFHHVPDVEQLFREAVRCLKNGARILIIDQNLGWISKPILKYFHQEPFDSETKSWMFSSSGPVSGANGALPWMVFERDRELFEYRFPEMKIERKEVHTPLRYWLAGGLKNWSLLPYPLYPLATKVDPFLVKTSPNWGSFVTIEISVEK